MDKITEVLIYTDDDRGMWGYPDMNAKCPHPEHNWCDRLYIKYIVARIGAFSNVWWTITSEWQSLESEGVKYKSDWLELGTLLSEEDKHHREASIHGTGWPKRPYYSHGEDWITHISLQGSEAAQLQDVASRWPDKVITERVS